MNKSLRFFAFFSCFTLLMSCAPGLHRGIPRGERHRRIEPEREAAVVQTVVETEEQPASLTEQAPLPVMASQAETTAIAAGTVQQAADVPESRLRSDDGGDTLIATEAPEDEAAQIAEALESEEVARNAYRFSWVPIGWTVFLPLLIVGIVGTAICLKNFKKYEFVTERGLEYTRRAKRTIFLSTLLSIPLVFALVLLIFLIALLLL
jgi:hypothetical protein